MHHDRAQLAKLKRKQNADKLGFVEYNGDMKVHPSLLNVVLGKE